ASAPATAVNAKSHQPPSQTAPITTGSPTIATRIRDQKACTPPTGRRNGDGVPRRRSSAPTPPAYLPPKPRPRRAAAPPVGAALRRHGPAVRPSAMTGRQARITSPPYLPPKRRLRRA